MGLSTASRRHSQSGGLLRLYLNRHDAAVLLGRSIEPRPETLASAMVR
jgi:hypothetical protein